MERAGTELQNIVADLLRRAPAEEAPLLAWPFVCGEAVARRTHAITYAQGVLRVEVPDKAWRAQLAELFPRYKTALNHLLPDVVERIEFTLAGQFPCEEGARRGCGKKR